MDHQIFLPFQKMVIANPIIEPIPWYEPNADQNTARACAKSNSAKSQFHPESVSALREFYELCDYCEPFRKGTWTKWEYDVTLSRL